MHIQPVVLAVIEKDNKILFTKRIDENPKHHDLWQLPGGGLEFGESPVQTLHREMMEELSAEVDNVKLIPYIDTKIKNNWHGIFISFKCNLKDTNNPIILNEEASEYRWFKKEEINYSKYNIFEGCVEIIEATLEY
jgi:8-oxo-dGTP diphosphatase